MRLRQAKAVALANTFSFSNPMSQQRPWQTTPNFRSTIVAITTTYPINVD